MTLAAGARLGPYEIVSMLGAGGMGEVYRARDTRLARTVALKVLHPETARDSDRRERFDREARAVSSLNHPHICTLHDIGQHDGVDFLVMEYLEGETLAERLQRGPLPLDQVLRYGSEMAGALDRAHRAGIVHRDLKPGNVMLTKSGVKLLDFGLAKLRADGGAGTVSAMMTAEKPLTGEGTLLGTLPYMSPEQVEGKDADARSDIWALGTVLYEMATGTRAFEGKSQASLIGAILKDEPSPITSRQPLAPPALDRVVRACLAKDRDERWQSAHDAAKELRWIAEAGERAPGRPRPRFWRLLLASAGVAILMTGGLLGWLGAQATGGFATDRDAPGPDTARRFSILLPEQAPLAPASATPFNYLRPSMAVSTDGSRIVYVASTREGSTQLYLRHADQYDAQPIPGTEGGFDPFLSPDGQWLGFFTFDTLLKVSLKGGAPLTLAAVVNPVGGTWCDDGTIYFSGEEGNTLWQMPGAGASGDQPALQVPLDDNVAYTSYPQCLPGSTGLLLAMVEPRGADRRASGSPASRRGWRSGAPLTADYAAVGVLPLPAHERSPRLLVSRGYAPQYAAGHLVFARGGNLVAAPFDLQQLRVTGPEAAVLSDVRMYSVSVPTAQFTLTRGGSLLYVPGGDHARTQLVWVDRQGRVAPTAAAPNLFGTLQLSPDGRRALVEVGGIQNDIYVYDLRDGRRIRITSEGRSGRRGIWHPDGRRVVFYSETDDRWVIQQVESDTGPEPLATVEGISSWSVGGTLAGARQRRIWIGSPERQTTITSAGREWGAVLSPDGALVAYTSARTGTFQVFAQPNPPTGHEWQVSSDFGEEPIWSRSSRELFFRRHNQWWSVPFVGGTPGPPHLLFEGPFFNASGPSYDVAPDGRFLMALPPAAAGATRELLWIEGWSEELRAKLPPAR